MKDFLRSVLRVYGNAIINLPGAARMPRFSHYAYRFTPLLFIAMTGESFVPLASAWIRLANTALFFAVMYTLWAGISHTTRLCERCIRAFPVNGSELAEHRRGCLHTYHFRRHRWMLTPIAMQILIMFAPPITGLYGWRVPAAQAPFALVFTWAWWRYVMTHDRLSAWCPWCRHNRPPEEAAQPDPDPADSKPVPA